MIGEMLSFTVTKDSHVWVDHHNYGNDLRVIHSNEAAQVWYAPAGKSRYSKETQKNTAIAAKHFLVRLLPRQDVNNTEGMRGVLKQFHEGPGNSWRQVRKEFIAAAEALRANKVST